MKRWVRAGLLVAVCVGLGGLVVPGSRAADLHFQAVDSVQFPSSYPIMQWHLADVDNDGYADLIALTWDSYFVYSFARDTIILTDTTRGLRFTGCYVTDFDHDGSLDLLLLDAGGKVLLQSGFLTPHRQVIDSVPYFTSPPVASHGIHLDPIRLNALGDSALVVAGVIEYALRVDPPRDVNVYDAGAVSLLGASSLDSVWLKKGTAVPSSEYEVSGDFSGDAVTDICTWGKSSHQYSVNDPYNGWTVAQTYGYQFSVYRQNGSIVRAVAASAGVAAVSGDLVPDRLGEEIIVFKDGLSFDSSIFKPASKWGAYCLVIQADSLAILWAKDCVAEGQASLFVLPSVPSTYSAWTNPSHCGLFSGGDGSEIAAIDGLRSGFETKEARVKAGSDSLIQLVQVSGTRAILMEQMEPTDVRDNAALVPKSFVLRQNYPNPFNGGTTIKYSLKRSAQVKLEVLNILGQVVATVVDDVQSKGEKSAVWTGTDSNGRPVASGTYFAKSQSTQSLGSSK